MKRTFYTTSWYVNKLTKHKTYDYYECKGSELQLYGSIEAAEEDAQWHADYVVKQGKKVKKPQVLRVRFERVVRKKK